MSRCFPFPPTGYTRNGSSSEALIESIKLRSLDKKSKKDHKKEKSSEKEKRKERKEASSKHKELKLIELEKIRADESSGCLLKVDYGEHEQVERSDITEEHDQPVSLSEPCCSDSIQSGSKRKRSVSPSSHNGGTGIRLRFSLKKHSEPEVYRVDNLVSTAAPARVVATADSSAQDTNGSHHQLRSAATAERDQFAGKTDLQSSRDGSASSKSSLEDSLRVEDGYQSLFQNWVPLPLSCDGYLSEDQDWLFSSEPKEERSISKKPKPVTSSIVRCSGPSLWPCAQFLPEVEVYALPYAVPF